jgi:CelD/BcsL family acetyltransferase involved in cellulose biosynthesis
MPISGSSFPNGFMISRSATSNAAGDITATLEATPDLPALRALWLDLEARAQPAFFLSWAWIGTWLECLPEDIRPRLLQARIGDRVVGLALVVDGPPRRKLGVEICRTAWLHETGREALDMLTIEHNDFLLDKGHATETRKVMLGKWLDALGAGAEVRLSGLAGPGWPDGVENGSRFEVARTDSVLRSYAVDLDAVREASGDFLKLIGSNTRSQIRRSMKEYRTLGDLSIEAAASVSEGLDWFGKLSDLHQARWMGKGQPGCFSNAFFRRFHHALIERELETGGVQLLRVRVGGSDLAYLYSFVKNGRACFYQSGLEYGLIGKHARPGLVAHVMAVEFNAAMGHRIYDFMAGDSRYKLMVRAAGFEPATPSV